MQAEPIPEVYLGTSGFSFDDWRGPVYPENLPKPQWLTFYEQQIGFNALEINYTYYQMPSHRTLEGMIRKTTDRFSFSIKTHRSLTHDVIQDGAIADNPKAFEEFRESMRPLVDAGRLGCVLAQFPYAFFNSHDNREYLAKTIDRLGHLNLVVEFRNKSWVTAHTFELLRRHNVGICTVDEPALPRLMPWLSEMTSDIAYVRFHGRNAPKWFGTSTEDRYNYLYSDEELQELAERVRAIAPKVRRLHLYFNNCHAGSAAKNAKTLKALLSPVLHA